MKIDTGHIITACLVKDEQGYSHPKHRDTRPSKDRKAPRGFRLRDLCSVIIVDHTKVDKDILKCMLKHT